MTAFCGLFTGESCWTYPSSGISAGLDAQCLLLQSKAYGSTQEAVRLFEQESEHLGDGNLSLDFRLKGIELSQGIKSAAEVYDWVNQQPEWLHTRDAQRRQINIALQDVIACEAIIRMGANSDIEAGLSHVCPYILCDKTVRSKLFNACQKQLRDLCLIGQYLQTLATPSANMREAAWKGKPRQRKGNRCKSHEKQCSIETVVEAPDVLRSDSGASGGDKQPAHENPDELSEAGQLDSVSTHDDHMDSVSIHADLTSGAPTDFPAETLGQIAGPGASGGCNLSMVTGSSMIFPSLPRCHAGPVSGLVPTLRPSNPLEQSLDKAFSELSALLEQASNDIVGIVDRNHAVRTLFQSTPSWCEHVSKSWSACPQPAFAALEWIRSCSAGWLTQQLKTLLVLSMMGVEWILPVIESTRDDALSRVVYGGLQKYVSIYGLDKADTSKVYHCVLSTDHIHYNSYCYVSYIRLLGKLLQGAALTESNLPQVDGAVRKVLEIAGWWHRNHFHEEDTAELLSQAFESLLEIFHGSPSLGAWERDICQLARWCIYNYLHMNSALGSAKRLLHMGGKTE